MEDVQELVAELRKHNGFRYPPELRGRVGRYVRAARAEGKPWMALHRELQLSQQTLRRWCQRAAQPATLQPVRLRQAVTRPALTLVSPEGWRFEGLDQGQAGELFAALAR